MSARDLATSSPDSLRSINRRIGVLRRRANWNGSVQYDEPFPGTAVSMASTATGGYPNSVAVEEASLLLDPGRWILQGRATLAAGVSNTGLFVEVGVILEWEDGVTSGERIARVGYERGGYAVSIDTQVTVAATLDAEFEASVTLSCFIGADPGFTSTGTTFDSAALIARPG